MTPTEALDEARKFSSGIAGWVDAQRAVGLSDPEIHAALKAATALVTFESGKPESETRSSSAE